MRKFDIIIIGGGHNGLVAASVLSKKGNKVLVIEKNENLGGLSNYVDSLSYISEEVLKELNIKIEKDINENYVSALSDDLNHTVLKITGKKNIEIDKRNFGKVSVISGLSEGDIVISEGVSKVRDKGKIKIIQSAK